MLVLVDGYGTPVHHPVHTIHSFVATILHCSIQKHDVTNGPALGRTWPAHAHNVWRDCGDRPIQIRTNGRQQDPNLELAFKHER